MKVKSSQYIKKVKPLLKVLLNHLLEHYEYASILASDSKAMTYSVSKRGTAISEEDFMSGRGFVVKVYDGKSYGEYSFNEIAEETIPVIIDRIRNHLMPLKKFLPEGITEIEYSKLKDEETVLEESSEYEQSPEEFGDDKIIEIMIGLHKAGLAHDARILDCAVICEYQKFHKLFLSKNKDMEQNILWTSGILNCMASKGEEIKYNYKGYSNLGGIEVLNDMQKDLKNVADTALALLDSKPIPPGEYDCICTPDVTGIIVHEAFGHGVEMDMFVKNRALAQKYMGEYVASPLITMHDGASAAKEVASYFFDDEGVMAQDTVIIDKGILKHGINDSQAAMYLSTSPTGNGRRESYERKAYTRMTNTYFEAGTDKLEDMIASIDHGYLLECACSGMEDPKNWGIQCMVNIAREIKNGKLTGEVYSPIVLTGYVPDLLKSISMVSDTCYLYGAGFCGKGYKEWVKVSSGGPYIKAKIRLG